MGCYETESVFDLNRTPNYPEPIIFSKEETQECRNRMYQRSKRMREQLVADQQRAFAQAYFRRPLRVTE